MVGQPPHSYLDSRMRSGLEYGKRHAVESFDSCEQDIPPMLAGGPKCLVLKLFGKLVTHKRSGRSFERCSCVLKFLKQSAQSPQRNLRRTSLIGQFFDETAILPVELWPVHVSSPRDARRVRGAPSDWFREASAPQPLMF